MDFKSILRSKEVFCLLRENKVCARGGGGGLLQYLDPSPSTKKAPKYNLQWLQKSFFSSSVSGVIGGKEFFASSQWLCELTAAVCLIACFCSIFTFTYLTCIRYFKLCHNEIHNNYYKSSFNIIRCCFIWIASLGIEIGNFFGWGDHYFDEKNHSCTWNRTKSASYTHFVAIVTSILPLTKLMTFLNIRMFYVMCRAKYRLSKQLNTIIQHTGTPVSKAWKEVAKATWSLFGVFIAYIICWLPYSILLLVDIGYNLPFEVHLWIHHRYKKLAADSYSDSF